MTRLHHRANQILGKLLETDIPFFIKDIASEFKVSERTIKYDLDIIRGFIKSTDIKIGAKPNKGIWIEGDRKKLLADLVADNRFNQSGVLSVDERRWALVLQLLLSDTYVTIQQIADATGVSRNTICNELENVVQLLSQWQITLDRVVHKGMRIIGDEALIRSAISYGIQNLLQGNAMTELLHGLLNENKQLPRISKRLSLLSLRIYDIEQIYFLVRQLINDSEIIEKNSLSERDVFRLFVVLCVMVQRVRSNHFLTKKENVKGVDNPPYKRLQEKLAHLGTCLEINIPETEIAYIWFHGFDFACDEHLKCDTIDNKHLVEEIIAEVGALIGLPFNEDSALYENLLIHLSERLTKNSRGVLVPNPLTSDIIRMYGDLFQHIKNVCGTVFAKKIVLNNADLAYITLHFQTSYERYFGRNKLRALVICSTGRGSASLLKTRLENEFKNIIVVSTCSVFEVNKAIELCNPDIVISVLPVELPLPVVIVNVILTNKDIERIYQTLKELGRGEKTMAKSVSSGRFFQEYLLQSRFKLSSTDFEHVETLTREVINQGFQISIRITNEFSDYLTDDALSGLTIHILHMVNRIAFSNPYVNLGIDDEPISPALIPLQDKLINILHEYYDDITDSEIRTILRYFVLNKARRIK